MSDLQKIARLKKRAESMRREADEAKGALNQCLETLKEEFDCASIEEAEELLETLHNGVSKAKGKLNRALSRYEARWGDEKDEESGGSST